MLNSVVCAGRRINHKSKQLPKNLALAYLFLDEIPKNFVSNTCFIIIFMLLCYIGISISALLYSNSVYPKPGEQTDNMMPSVCCESTDKNVVVQHCVAD